MRFGSSKAGRYAAKRSFDLASGLILPGDLTPVDAAAITGDPGIRDVHPFSRAIATRSRYRRSIQDRSHHRVQTQRSTLTRMTCATKPGRVFPCLSDRLARASSAASAVLQVILDVEMKPLFCVLKRVASKLVLVWILQGDSWWTFGWSVFHEAHRHQCIYNANPSRILLSA